MEKINDEKALDCRDAIIDLKEQEYKLIDNVSIMSKMNTMQS